MVKLAQEKRLDVVEKPEIRLDNRADPHRKGRDDGTGSELSGDSVNIT